MEKQKKVLIVEDDSSSRMILRATLEEDPFRTPIAQATTVDRLVPKKGTASAPLDAYSLNTFKPDNRIISR